MTGRLDGPDDCVSDGSSLGVSLGFRLGKVDGRTDGTDNVRDDGPLVASDGLFEETIPSVGNKMGKIDEIAVGSLEGITVGLIVGDEQGDRRNHRWER